MCPAAAAGLEYDYSTRNEILIIASRSISISILEVHNRCLGTEITIFCRRPITLREEFFYIFLQLGGGDFFGSHKPAVQIVLVRHHVPKLAARGQEPAAGTGRGPQRRLPFVVGGRVAFIVQCAVAVGLATPGCLEVAHLPVFAGMGRHIVVHHLAVGITVPVIQIIRDIYHKVAVKFIIWLRCP